MQKEQIVKSLRDELREKKMQMYEFKLLVYKHYYTPTWEQIEKFKSWQEDIDYIEKELLGVMFGVNLDTFGFNWVELLENMPSKYTKSEYVETLTHSCGRLKEALKELHGDIVVQGPSFYTETF